VQSRLPGLDLNLLVALDALLREAHVTRAARRIGLSQSAMSHALSRLRLLFDDPLLVRAGRSMTLTARAQQIAAPLAEALSALDGVIGPPAPFEPAAVERELRIAAIDYAQLVLLPPLVADLARRAPGLTLSVLPPAEPLERALADGSFDLAIGLARPPAGMHQERLLEERFVCVVRRRHPIGARLGLRDYARFPHVLVSPRGRVPGAVDPALHERGLVRRVVLVSPQTLSAGLVVARSDAILTIAERVARIALQGLPVRILKPPIALAPFTVTMLWHPRLDTDPVHGFVRERLLGAARAAQ
jgi:DNA-binding transcriptional LysR family regulator